MEIAPLSAGRLRGERLVLRDGAAISSTAGTPLRLVRGRRAMPSYCAGCAAPIESGAVVRGTQAFCSVECILGGDFPA